MAPDLTCPACRVALQPDRGALCCTGPCGRVYPVVAGIPDLRLAGDLYLTLEEDRAKAVELDRVPGGFEEVLRAYWERTPEVPGELARRYVDAALAGVRRSQRHLDRMGPIDGPLLDVGCGTGGLLLAAAQRGLAVSGVDIALRWLVVARRRLDEAGHPAQLVAADGARLPFDEGAFGGACCTEVVEHTLDQRGLIRGCLAAVGPGGRVEVVVANRFSLAPEPTVGLWLVGYLPRRWANRYVAMRRNTRYQHFRALGRRELRALVGPGRTVEIGPGVLPPPAASASVAVRALDRGYGHLRSAPATRAALSVVAPYLEVVR